MAQVWEAHDRVLGRDVAVKLLHDHLAADAVFVERFRNEAVAAGRLAHPSIVSIFDVCSDERREAIVMELVRGQSLRQYLNDVGQIDPQQAVPWMIQVADALTAAHEQGVVHRDIKPGNILIVNVHRVKVTDFGIAKASTAADLTETGMMMGTAKYLAPEQVAGDPVDGRADVYALGIVAYESLCGVVPFYGDNDTATAVMRLQRDPVFPRQYRPDISPELEAVIMTALARDPQHRYRSAEAFKDALRTTDTNLYPTGAASQDAAGDPLVVLVDEPHPQTGVPTASAEALPVIDLDSAEQHQAGASTIQPDAGRYDGYADADGGYSDADYYGDGYAEADPAYADATATPGHDPYAAGEYNDSDDYDDEANRAVRLPEERGQQAQPLPRQSRTPQLNMHNAGLALIALLAIAALGVAGALFGRTNPGASVADSIRDTFGFGRSDTPNAEDPIPVENESQSANTAAIATITSFDPPPGDGEEIESRLTQAVDDDLETSWRTERYSRTREFGGLKSGVGVVLELEEVAELDTLIVQSQTPGWDAQVYLSDDRQDLLSNWGDPVGTINEMNDRAEVDLGQREAQHVLIFLTRLAETPADDGRFFAAISEIEVRTG